MFFGDARRWDGRGWLMPDSNPHWKDLKSSLYLVTWFATYGMDITGHELTHGVVQMTAGLGKEQKAKSPEWCEAFTLNEHIADCFAIMVKHFSARQTAESGSQDLAPSGWSESAVRARG